MPRNIRNWWLTLDVDGRKTQIATGPRGKDGGFTLRIQQRHDGGIVDVGTLVGWVLNEKLCLQLVDSGGNVQPLAGTLR